MELDYLHPWNTSHDYISCSQGSQFSNHSTQLTGVNSPMHPVDLGISIQTKDMPAPIVRFLGAISF